MASYDIMKMSDKEIADLVRGTGTPERPRPVFMLIVRRSGPPDLNDCCPEPECSSQIPEGLQPEQAKFLMWRKWKSASDADPCYEWITSDGEWKKKCW